jgi:hypothetical protein
VGGEINGIQENRGNIGKIGNWKYWKIGENTRKYWKIGGNRRKWGEIGGTFPIRKRRASLHIT